VLSVELDAINNFNPDKSAIPDLYNSFRKEIQSANTTEASFKAEILAEDKPLDEALWLLETSLNTNYGFRQDNLVDFSTEVFEFTVINKSVNANGMPVIGGQELVSAYYNLVDAIDYSGSENEYFRFGMVEVSQVTTETSTVVLESESGYYYTGVLPPGVDPSPFPPGDDQTASWAADQFDIKINMRSGLIPWEYNPDYILTLECFGRSGASYPNDLWFAPAYANCGVTLTTSLLNEYLFSTKDFIDIYNPVNDPNIWLAQVYIYCMSDGNYRAYHVVEFYRLHRELVGGGTT